MSEEGSRARGVTRFRKTALNSPALGRKKKKTRKEVEEEEEEEEEPVAPQRWQDALPRGAIVLDKPARLTRKPLLKKRILLHGLTGWFCGIIKMVHSKGKVTIRFPGYDMYQVLSLDLCSVTSDVPSSWMLYR